MIDNVELETCAQCDRVVNMLRVGDERTLRLCTDEFSTCTTDEDVRFEMLSLKCFTQTDISFFFFFADVLTKKQELKRNYVYLKSRSY